MSDEGEFKIAHETAQDKNTEITQEETLAPAVNQGDNRRKPYAEHGG